MVPNEMTVSDVRSEPARPCHGVNVILLAARYVSNRHNRQNICGYIANCPYGFN